MNGLRRRKAWHAARRKARKIESNSREIAASIGFASTRGNAMA
jgi:AraC-like DNA-binding protein